MMIIGGPKMRGCRMNRRIVFMHAKRSSSLKGDDLGTSWNRRWRTVEENLP